MAKRAYIGVNGVARKIKKGYLGIDGVARRIRKAYIGIGGVARPCWGSGELEYYGTVTPLSVARANLAAVTIGDYALFGGGYGGSYSKDIDIYDKSLTFSVHPEGLGSSSSLRATATVGDYGIFGGGLTSSAKTLVNAFDKSLTRKNPSALTVARGALAATSVGDYALFGGGSSS